MKKKRSDILITIFLVVIMLIGVAVFFYPAFSNWWNARVQTQIIDNYNKAVGNLDNSEKEKLLEKAREYNSALDELADPLADYEKVSGYEDILDITGTGIMGYIEIPKINVYLPIYHGTSPEVLNVAVGHLQGSYLPIGEIGHHSVISAHRGLPSAKLFTDLDQLTEDDRFSITILDEVYTYEIDQINVVLPTENSLLRAEPDIDIVTLMTCTPYGINTHRLLVRGRRVDTVTAEDENHKVVRIPADAVIIDNMTTLPFIIIPLIVILILVWIKQGKYKNKKYMSGYTVKKYIDINERHGEKDAGQK